MGHGDQEGAVALRVKSASRSLKDSLFASPARWLGLSDRLADLLFMPHCVHRSTYIPLSGACALAPIHKRILINIRHSSQGVRILVFMASS